LFCHEVGKVPRHFSHKELSSQFVKAFKVFSHKLYLEFLCEHKTRFLQDKIKLGDKMNAMSDLFVIMQRYIQAYLNVELMFEPT